MASWDILELDSLPRERGKLQALLNEHRHQRRAARRRRMLLIVLAALVSIGVGISHVVVGPLLVTPVTVAYAVSVAAAIVLLLSLPRAFRSRRAARVPLQTQE